MTPPPAATVQKTLSAYRPEKDTVLTIGVFDGVHRGHQKLIGAVVSAARKRGLLSGVITFQSHPRKVLAHGNGLQFINDLDERLARIRSLGVDFVAAIPFSAEIARLSAAQFVALLQSELRMAGLVIGPDFALGHGREGNAESLRALGREHGFTVDVVSASTVGGEVVSSTLLRQALADGDMLKAEKLLGHPFYLKGHIIHGRQHGRVMGFPTANLSVPAEQILPANGVYVSQTHFDGKTYPSVTNIGFRPTFGASERTIETFILDYDGDLYDRAIKVDLVDRLRDEMKFPDVAALKSQIDRDIELARQVLAHREHKVR
jgi:riboflavin kinase/FMN adenylyltransferase